MAKLTTSDALITLAARIPREHRDALDERAARAGCSRSEYVASLIREHVSDDDRDDALAAIREQAEELRCLLIETRQLRRDVATVLELTLLNLTDHTEAEVRKCVSEVLRSGLGPESID